MPWRNVAAMPEEVKRAAAEKLIDRGIFACMSLLLAGFIWYVYRDVTTEFLPTSVATIQYGYEKMDEQHRKHLAERDAAFERLLATSDRLTREVLEELRASRELRRSGK